ncbi:MAG TPA: hypothetical protein VMU48_17260 [Terracidiphilus sp.]|nr:hypothetical protein [Terracidiphilus sp.]
MPRQLRTILLIASALLAHEAHAQVAETLHPPPIKVCPGAFPTDLEATDCSYTPSQRALDFVSGSVTDQAVLGAVVFGLGAQVIQSPSEWKRTWDGYSRRVGSRYTQALGKGTAQYLVGFMLNDDPRFLAYRNDPAVLSRRQKAVLALTSQRSSDDSQPEQRTSNKSLDVLAHDGWQRFGHAWYDVITVRRSTQQGNGHRIPAFSRFSGEVAGAYAGYPWYPGPENTVAGVGQRAAGAFGTAVLSSFYTEYKPEITNLLGAVFRRGRQSTSSAGGSQ